MRLPLAYVSIDSFAAGATAANIVFKLSGLSSWPWWAILAPAWGSFLGLNLAVLTASLYQRWRRQ